MRNKLLLSIIVLFLVSAAPLACSKPSQEQIYFDAVKEYSSTTVTILKDSRDLNAKRLWGSELWRSEMRYHYSKFDTGIKVFEKSIPPEGLQEHKAKLIAAGRKEVDTYLEALDLAETQRINANALNLMVALALANSGIYLDEANIIIPDYA